MSHPPLFLILTSYQTGQKIHVLLSKVHGMERDEGDVATKIKTFVENGVIEAFIVKERPEKIVEKAQKLSMAFIKAQVSAGKAVMNQDEWDRDDDDDHDCISFSV